MLRNFLMLILILIFVFLYAAAFSGKLDPLKDNTMLLHLEPIIFILIAQQERETLEEKIKNAKTSLKVIVPGTDEESNRARTKAVEAAVQHFGFVGFAMAKP